TTFRADTCATKPAVIDERTNDADRLIQVELDGLLADRGRVGFQCREVVDLDPELYCVKFRKDRTIPCPVLLELADHERWRQRRIRAEQRGEDAFELGICRCVTGQVTNVVDRER